MNKRFLGAPRQPFYTPEVDSVDHIFRILNANIMALVSMASLMAHPSDAVSRK